MRLVIIGLFILTTWIAKAQEESFVCKEHLLTHAADANLSHEFRTSPYTNNYDLRYYRLEWQIDPSQYYIRGQVTPYFQPNDPSFTRIYFDLASSLQVNSVKYHGQDVSYTLMNNLLEINFPQTLADGILDSLTIDYEGAPPSTGFGSFGQTFHNNAPVLWTLSEPYGGRDWWPCKIDLADKIDSIDVYVTTPQGFRAASNGVLASEVVSGNDVIYHWKHRYPITGYLVAIAVTNYVQYSDFVPMPNGETLEMLNYVYPESLSQAQAGTSGNVQVLQLFNQLFGVYPFATEKYGHAQFSWGGGEEHQTMSFVGGFSHLLLSHELAHQWFGDMVTCGSWQDIWLNEGFATYCEGMTYENGLGPNTWPAWLSGKISQITGNPDGSVWVPDTTNVNRIFSSRLTYSKGAMVLHMLRWKVGSENFFQAIRNYTSDPQIAYNYARTSQLQAHMEAQSGIDLDEFFEDWFYGQGYPSYQFQWGYDAQQQLRIQINQTTSNASVDFFEMPVPVKFSGQGQDSILVFDHTASGQVFHPSLPFTVEQITFDPQLWILSANNQITVGTQERNELNQALYLYPNPVVQKLRFDLGLEGVKIESVRITNLAGQSLIDYPTLPDNQEMDLETLPAGFYILQLNTNQGIAIKSFVKQ